MQANALKNCNVLPFTKEEPSSTKALKATILMVAVSAFVVGFLAILVTQNVFACGLSQIGTIGAGCMMGAGALLFLALYYFRKSAKDSPSDILANYSGRAKAILSTPLTLEERVEQLPQTELLALPFSNFGNIVSVSRYPLLVALCKRFHTTELPKKAAVNTDLLTLGDIPSLNGEQISKGLKQGTFPKQLLICLSPEQVRTFNEYLMSTNGKDSTLTWIEGQQILANDLFQMDIGSNADAHLTKVYRVMHGTLDNALGTEKVSYFT